LEDDCVEYECIKLKHDKHVAKMFFIFVEFVSLISIKLCNMLSRSSEEIITLMCKSRFAEEIVCFMRETMATTNTNDERSVSWSKP